MIVGMIAQDMQCSGTITILSIFHDDIFPVDINQHLDFVI